MKKYNPNELRIVPQMDRTCDVVTHHIIQKKRGFGIFTWWDTVTDQRGRPQSALNEKSAIQKCLQLFGVKPATW